MEYRPARWEVWLEPIAAVAFLLGFVFIAPLASRHFVTVVAWASVGVALYATLRIALKPPLGLRWGLPGFGRFDAANSLYRVDGELGSCLLLGGTFLVSLLPMVLLREFIALPVMPQPLMYFGWCVIQDFIFFALIQRNLEDLMDSHVAVAIAATLFGFSHYPHTGFMVATALIGATWGLLYVQTRSLLLIVLTHWVMGFITLGKWW